MSSRRFRIAFSFAGEKRDFVAKVAHILADCFGEAAILYDKYHEAEFAVYDLGIRLPKLYGEQSDLIIPVLCPKYDAKRWTGWEWVHIYGLLTKADGHRVMPCRFDHANTDGLSPAAGFIELDHKTPEQAAALILERLALNEGHLKDYYSKPAISPLPVLKTSIPHNLPTLQPFFGREDELKKIADALDPENRGWGALIDGPGGMGKTSLAVRAAYNVSPDVFKRIAFVSLKTRELDDDGVRDLSGFILTGFAELFNELSRELGLADIAKASEDQRPRLLLDSLRDTRTLLVLDNLESLTKPERDRLFTFVKKLPQGCKAILTARGRIGSGAEELILQKISQEAALATLAELATHNPHLAKTNEAERVTLYRQTGGKPLLLRWTAGQLGRGHCLTFTDALFFLRSCPEGNDPLEFIFGDLVEDFSVEETHVLSALSYFTLPSKVEHIAEIAQCSIEEADRALRCLSVRSIAVPSDESKTFTLVPLVADFLRKKKPEVVAKTGNRLDEHGFTLLVENGYDNHDRFPILDAAWPTVAATLPRLLAGSNARLQIACFAVQDFLNFIGRWDESLALSRDAESKAVAEQDYLHAGWRAYEAGNIHTLRGEPTDVLACASRVESHWRAAKVGARERAIAASLRGNGHQLAHDYPAAIAVFQEVVEVWRKLSPESKEMATGLNDLAAVEQLSGDLDAAERDYREALRISKAIGDHERIAVRVGNLAGLALVREDWPGGETLAREALSLAKEVGRRQLVAGACHRLAVALVRQGKKKEALAHAQCAVDVYAQLGSRVMENAHAILMECKS